MLALWVHQPGFNPHVANQRRAERKRIPGSGGGRGFVRIIGGEWRGRRLPVADAPGLRPSGDRARETLFNWLTPHLPGARCADLFAGTGALGFEAASRGAREVVLVERSRPLAAMLRESAELLKAERVEVVNADALEWLKGRPGSSLDIVFIDPPFDGDLAQRALQGLVESGCLTPGALVYLECPGRRQPSLPAGFGEDREKTLGEVRMALLCWQPPRP